jgi:hypothetical protein
VTRRGSVLILALWVLMVLGFLALAVGGHVSANMQVARHLKYDATAYYLARAGVALAVSEIMADASNVVHRSPYESGRDTALLQDNPLVPGGAFSVYYTFDDTNGTETVIRTNYGVVAQNSKIDLHRPDIDDWRRLEGVLGALEAPGDLAGTILSNYPARKQETTEKTVAREQVKRYGPYEALQELLAIDGMDRAVFDELERLVTLKQFERWYAPGSGELWRRDSYGGVAEGRALTTTEDAASVAAVRKIVFVFDRFTTNFLYWREQ